MKTNPLSPLFTLLALTLAAPLAQAAGPFQPLRPEQVPAGDGYRVTQPPVESPALFRGKRIAILASHGVEEPELLFPYLYLTARGAQVDILTPNWAAQGIVISRFLRPSAWANSTATFGQALQAPPSYDLMILTGGAWNAQVVKTDNDALALIRRHVATGKPLAAICAGTEVLVFAGLAKGQRIAPPPYARLTLANAGAIVVDQPAVFAAGGRLLTSRDPNDLEAFVEGLKRQLLGAANFRR